MPGTLRLSVALFAILSALLAAPAMVSALVQEQDAVRILESSARAMDEAQSARLDGTMTLDIAYRGESASLVFAMSGEAQGVDRSSLTLRNDQFGVSREIIIIGERAWTRSGSGPWQTGLVHPALVGATNQDWVRTLTNPVVSDLGAAYRVTAGLDMTNPLNLGYADTMVDAVRSYVPFDLTGLTGQVSLNVDKSTGYWTSQEILINMAFFDQSGSVNGVTALSFSEFNNPNIRIAAPA